MAESLDDWQQEQTTDRAKLEDLSLEKKKLRLKTVQRTFKLVEDLVKLESEG